MPHFTRSSLHRCLRRHGISRLPDTEGDQPSRSKFKRYPIGYFHIDIAEVLTEQGKFHLFVAIDRTSKFAFAELHEKAACRGAANFFRALADAVPYTIHTVLTDNGTHFTESTGDVWDTQGHPANDGLQRVIPLPRLRVRLRRARYRAQARQASAPMDEWAVRAHEPHH